MEEISKLGDINTVNDFFEYKLSIKTILIIIFVWGAIFLIIVIIAFGGINNAANYLISVVESIKTTLVEIKNKNTGNNSGRNSAKDSSAKDSSATVEDQQNEKSDIE